jgi:lysophospholipase L1-like esterase
MNSNQKTKRRLSKPFVIVVSIILVLAGFAGLSVYFDLGLTMGTGKAGPDVPIEPFKKVWSEKKIQLLGLGDSITAGFGVPKGYGYFDMLVKNPDNNMPDMAGRDLSIVFPKLLAENKSVSGSDSKHHLEKQIGKIAAYPADVFGVVVITTGGNDLIHSYGKNPPKECAMYGATLEQAKPWIDNYQSRLEQIILQIKSKFPGGCEIFIADIYDPSDGTGDTKKWLTGLPKWKDGEAILKCYNDIIENSAEKYKNVHFVGIHDEFLGHGIHCKKFWLRNYKFSDSHYWYNLGILEDPNLRGYDAIRRLFLQEMIEVFWGGKG